MRNSVLAVLAIALSPISAPAQLVVHEWGTFTSFQDETGRAIGGINTDDEPVPDFVHRAAFFIQSADEVGKGIPANDSDVTMRLETPVMYFHLPAGSAEQTVDVNAAFHGGWLTEYFPDARAVEPGLNTGNVVGHLSADTIGTIQWRGVKVGGIADGPATSDPVWTSPRDVQCDPVKVGTEAEKFLFYRGVGHLDSPLRVVRETSANVLRVYRFTDVENPAMGRAWLTDVRADGTMAARSVDLNSSANSKLLATVSAEFADSEFGDGQTLRAQLRQALLRQGLFADEADALLNTWRKSYFRNSGLRLFFLVNPTWTNNVLPVRVSGAASITRVMVGRIELVTPWQRELVRQIANSPLPDLRVALKDACPPYEQLGRFRNALLLDELSQRPNVTLARLLTSYSIRAFPPP